MTKHIRFLFACLVLCIAVPATGLAASPEDLFRQGREAILKKDWQKAEELLSASWAVKQSFDTAALLGQSELELGKHRAAAEHLDYALRVFPNTSPAPDAKERMTAALKEAQKRVFTLTLSVRPDGAEITVDGKSLGRSPLTAPLFLDVGPHDLAVKLAGHTTAERRFTATAGGSDTFEFELAEEQRPIPSGASGQGAAPGATQPDDGGRTGRDERSMVPVYVASGFALVGVGVGVGFALRSNNKASDRDSALSQLPSNSACANGSGDADLCDRIQELEDQRTSARTVAYVGFGVAGAAALGAVAYLVWPSSSQTTASVTPLVGQNAAGFVFSGSY